MSYPREGARWAHYEIRHEIARGNMGVVYRALDTRSGRDVALKLLVASGNDPDAPERFRREAKSLARLEHPNVVGVQSFGVQEGLPFMAMDFVAGTTLHELIERGSLTLSRAVALLAGVARGLDHAHSRGILHRDVKPANILIGPEGRPRLTDFGLAKLSDASLSLTQEGDIIGTPVFMSPEQILGDVRLMGPGLDVWAMGVILYVLLTKGLPFKGRTVEEVSEAVVQFEPRPPRELDPSLPEDLERICLCALQKDTTQRYRSAGELGRDLEAYLRGGQVLAGTVTLGVRARRAARFMRLHAGGVAALLAGLVLVLAGAGLKSYLDAREAGEVDQKQRARLLTMAEEIAVDLDLCAASLGAGEAARAQGALERAEKSLERVSAGRGQAAGEQAELVALQERRAGLRAQLAVAVSRDPQDPALAEVWRAARAGDLASAAWALDHAERLGSALEWAAYLPAPAELEESASAEGLLALSVARERLRGVERPWAALLARPSKSSLGAAARLYEATWLLDRQRYEEARRVLWSLDQEGQRAPLLHARLLRAIQRDDPQTYSLRGSGGWRALHARLLDRARASGQRLEVDLATAELALLQGELARARAVLEPWGGGRLVAGRASEVAALDLCAQVLQGKGEGGGLALRLLETPGASAVARTRLAWLTQGAEIEGEPSPEALAARLSLRVDRALGLLALRSLGEALESPALTSAGESEAARAPTLPTELQSFGPGDARAQHLSLRVRVALIHLAAARTSRARELLEEGLSSANLTHPELSLALRLLESAPLELPVAPWWSAPVGLVSGRRWGARYEALGGMPEGEDAWRRAKSSLDLALNLAPTDPAARLARARLRLLRAASSGTERKNEREGALRDASVALAAAPDLRAAWHLFLDSAWTVDSATLPQVLRSKWLESWLSGLHPAESLALTLLDQGELPSPPPWYASLAHAQAQRLRLIAGEEVGISPAPPTQALREALAAAAGAPATPLEGELLLRDPEWLAQHLLGRCAAPVCVLSGPEGAAWALTEEQREGPFASAARALLLIAGLRAGEGDTPQGRGRLEALWRDEGGLGCLRLEVAWVLWTHPAAQRVLLDDLGPLPGEDPLAAVVRALRERTGVPAGPLAVELWEAEPVKRWR